VPHAEALASNTFLPQIRFSRVNCTADDKKLKDWFVIVVVAGILLTSLIATFFGLSGNFADALALLWVAVLLIFHPRTNQFVESIIGGITNTLFRVLLVVLAGGLVLGLIYLVVKFIKSFWYH
jgi:hypothetical protein